MDYVVAGFGIGAILALIGFALWERYGNVEEPGTSWLSRAAIGLMLGALVIWAVTGVSLISHIDDSTGARLVLLTTLVSLIAIAGGSFFYWRADRALAAAMPRPTRASAQRELVPAVAAPLAHEDIELTEWDSWPERKVGKPVEPEAEAVEPVPEPSFEPEVAVEAVPDSDSEADDSEKEIDGADVVDIEPAKAEAEPKEPVAQPDAAAAELPANVRPFRLPAPSEPVKSAGAADVAIAESVEIDEAEATGEQEAAAIEVEEAERPTVAEAGDQVSGEEEDEQDTLESANEQAARTAYESSLLADIDGSLADEEGGYRSPLLSDLGSDKLEGVGLAKWRPDARLTEQDDDDAAPPAKRGRRG